MKSSALNDKLDFSIGPTNDCCFFSLSIHVIEYREAMKSTEKMVCRVITTIIQISYVWIAVSRCKQLLSRSIKVNEAIKCVDTPWRMEKSICAQTQINLLQPFGRLFFFVRLLRWNWLGSINRAPEKNPSIFPYALQIDKFANWFLVWLEMHKLNWIMSRVKKKRWKITSKNHYLEFTVVHVLDSAVICTKLLFFVHAKVKHRFFIHFSAICTKY